MHPLASETALLIPTLNGGALWRECVAAIQAQTLQPARIIVADSASTDETVAVAQAAGFTVIPIERAHFDHGGTRQMLAEQGAPLPYLVYLTQDAVLDHPESLASIVVTLTAAPSLAAVCGRQLPHHNASLLAAHARLYNYPATSRRVDSTTVQGLGLKAVYMSNSFAAYRREALAAIGGFPDAVIFGEDMIVAAKLVLAGWQVAYDAGATARHSHDYSLAQDFRRAFDIGVMHTREYWLLQAFGQAEGEGLAFVRAEMRFLARTRPVLIPLALAHTAVKLTGYKLGRHHRRLPASWAPRLSLHRRWWAKQRLVAGEGIVPEG
jgi:rhamnosyltransferase